MVFIILIIKMKTILFMFVSTIPRSFNSFQIGDTVLSRPNVPSNEQQRFNFHLYEFDNNFSFSRYVMIALSQFSLCVTLDQQGVERKIQHLSDL